MENGSWDFDFPKQSFYNWYVESSSWDLVENGSWDFDFPKQSFCNWYVENSSWDLVENGSWDCAGTSVRLWKGLGFMLKSLLLKGSPFGGKTVRGNKAVRGIKNSSLGFCWHR